MYIFKLEDRETFEERIDWPDGFDKSAVRKDVVAAMNRVADAVTEAADAHNVNAVAWGETHDEDMSDELASVRDGFFADFNGGDAVERNWYCPGGLWDVHVDACRAAVAQVEAAIAAAAAAE